MCFHASRPGISPADLLWIPHNSAWNSTVLINACLHKETLHKDCSQSYFPIFCQEVSSFFNIRKCHIRKCHIIFLISGIVISGSVISFFISRSIISGSIISLLIEFGEAVSFQRWLLINLHGFIRIYIISPTFFKVVYDITELEIVKLKR